MHLQLNTIKTKLMKTNTKIIDPVIQKVFRTKTTYAYTYMMMIQLITTKMMNNSPLPLLTITLTFIILPSSFLYTTYFYVSRSYPQINTFPILTYGNIDALITGG